MLSFFSTLTADEIVEAIKNFPNMEALRLEGNTVGRQAAEEIAKALERHPELKVSAFY